MNLKNITLSTLIPQYPSILNYNNQEIKRYLDVFYDEDAGVIVVPVNTSGRVKAASGEFVNVVVDNLTVKNQYTNLYENSTTADYDWYEMIINSLTFGRDPCTFGIDTSVWTVPYEPSAYKVIDVNKAYYKISNEDSLFLANSNLSQVVGIYFDSSTYSANDFEILLDPCSGLTYDVSLSDAGKTYVELICIEYDASWGSTWMKYK